MGLLDIFKKSQKAGNKRTITEDQAKAVKLAIDNHKVRVENLREHMTLLYNEIEHTHLDSNITANERNKKIYSLVRRVALTRYEIETREELIKWLS
jgi:DNA polymerase sigma